MSVIEGCDLMKTGEFFNGYPYTNYHELNLDFILNKIQEITNELKTFKQINVLKYAEQNSIQIDSYETLLADEKIQLLFSKEVHSLVSVSTGFRSCERINTFALLPESFKIGEELSAKQEMIRPKIMKKYEKEISSLF